DDFGLKIGKLSHRTSIKDGLGRHIGSCGPLNRNFPKKSINNQRDIINLPYISTAPEVGLKTLS
ncbi:hypothetical protein ACEA83_21405, partial [Escherichia coli]